ncbi:hypothetical protein J422_02729 [Methanocaldococcus villosus KIN24-T80]|uniref:D-aminoacyl-tRNA deacylase n=1 Tax=Methanocaldococcus villosus KIN24-T80 TaxID=1069083 RepID=N6VR25_9EURY|nr:D-aminoacyl-tRNA deacylase [Methanocaldococcus villosus]ENN96360.1 hypothetical protein J422_02729 [Methanocaldococcus villosus KIN24-T80]
MKFLFISSNLDPASKNIASFLNEYFEVFKVEKELLNVKKEDLPKASYYIFLSKHRSSSNQPSLTVHVPGLLDRDVCSASAVLNSLLLNNIYNFYRKSNLNGFNVCFEVVHHTPTDIDKPTCFVEIGSTEKEWKDERLGKIMADAIVKTVEQIESGDYDEKIKAVGYGGNHYAPKFTKLCLEGKYYFSYLIPKYANVSENVLKKIVKSDVERLLIDWKGSKSEGRKKMIEFFKSYNIDYERV